MVDITSISHGDSSGLLCNIHYIVISVLRLIGEDHRITAQDEETSTSHGPPIKPPVSSTAVKMLSIRGRGRGRGRGQPSQAGKRGSRRPVIVNRVVVLLVIPLMRLSYHLSIPHHPQRLSYCNTPNYTPNDKSKCIFFWDKKMLKRKFRKIGIYTKDKGKLVIHQFRTQGS